MRILIVGLGLLLLSSVAEAQPLVSTQNGSANRNSVQLFSLLPLLGGQVDVSISWTNRNADLFVLLVCGVDDPLTYGIGAGLLQQNAAFTSGVPPDEDCAIGVSSVGGGSRYRRCT